MNTKFYFALRSIIPVNIVKLLIICNISTTISKFYDYWVEAITEIAEHMFCI